MKILYAFAPFIVFALITRWAGSTPGLTAGAIVAAALLARDWMGPARAPKVLEVGTVVLFGGLAIYAWAAAPAWSIVGVRLGVDAGLLLIILVSLAIRRPFTIQYAREDLPRDRWHSPEFIRTNYIVTAAWAAAFVVMVVADVMMLYVRSVPRSLPVIATVIALLGAAFFTARITQPAGRERTSR